MSQQPCGHRVYCGNVGADELMQRKWPETEWAYLWLGDCEYVQPTGVTPTTKDGSKNRPLYSKYSLYSASSRRKHTPTHTHTQTFVHVLRVWFHHSSVLLRIQNNNNNKSVIIPKRCFSIYFQCLSSLCLISHLIWLLLQPGAVQEEGQRSRLLFYR